MRYFFHVEDGDSFLDTEGQELAHATAAKIEAARMLGELLKDHAEAFWDHRALKLIVTDEAGLILFVLDLSAVEAPAISLRSSAQAPPRCRAPRRAASSHNKCCAERPSRNGQKPRRFALGQRKSSYAGPWGALMTQRSIRASLLAGVAMTACALMLTACGKSTSGGESATTADAATGATGMLAGAAEAGGNASGGGGTGGLNAGGAPPAGGAEGAGGTTSGAGAGAADAAGGGSSGGG